VATFDKDFKVKNGLSVALGGIFGGTVSAQDPVENNHLATKLYVDTAVSGFTVESSTTFPASPEQGQLFFDEISEHLYIYNESTWYSIALLDDTLDLPQHIHDTSIDGTGLVVSTFKDAGYYNDSGDYVDAGTYSTNVWEVTWDGGYSIDNFN
jgi:hypothetical protein